MKYQNSIFYKSLCALYNLNIDKNGETKSVLIDAVYHALLIGKEGLDETKLQMALKTATGSWLDYWGEFYGVLRLFDESDEEYRFRIIDEITSLKVTIPALKQGVTRYLNTYQKEDVRSSDVQVFEPWTDLIKLDERGALDGRGRIIDYHYWNYAVVDISLPDTRFISRDLIEYLNKIKAAGVKLEFTTAPAWELGQDPDREEKRYRIWRKIQRDLCLETGFASDGFKLRKRDYPPFEDKETGSILDGHGRLDGRPVLYSYPIDIIRDDYFTGVIRDYRESRVLSVEVLENLLKDNNHLEGIYHLELESLTAPRLNEGVLTKTLGQIGIIREKINMVEGAFVPFSRKNKVYEEQSIYSFVSLEDILNVFGNDFTTLELHNITKTNYQEKEKIKKLNALLQEGFRKEHYRTSQQQPLEVLTEKI